MHDHLMPVLHAEMPLLEYATYGVGRDRLLPQLRGECKPWGGVIELYLLGLLSYSVQGRRWLPYQRPEQQQERR